MITKFQRCLKTFEQCWSLWHCEWSLIKAKKIKQVPCGSVRAEVALSTPPSLRGEMCVFGDVVFVCVKTLFSYSVCATRCRQNVIILVYTNFPKQLVIMINFLKVYKYILIYEITCLKNTVYD